VFAIFMLEKTYSIEDVRIHIYYERYLYDIFCVSNKCLIQVLMTNKAKYIHHKEANEFNYRNKM